MRKYQKAYDRGYREYMEGYRAIDCPYSQYSDLYDSWHEGWFDARQDAIR